MWMPSPLQWRLIAQALELLPGAGKLTKPEGKDEHGTELLHIWDA